MNLVFINQGMVCPYPCDLWGDVPEYLYCSQIETVDPHPHVRKGGNHRRMDVEQQHIRQVVVNQKNPIGSGCTGHPGIAARLVLFHDMNHGQDHVAVGKGTMETVHHLSWTSG